MAATIFSPQTGDLLLRGSFAAGFDLLDAQTLEPVMAGRHSLSEAIAIARQHGADALWQLNADERGRAIGAPFRLPLRASAFAISVAPPTKLPSSEVLP